MIVVSDTSPVSNLIDLDHVWLLPQLFKEVVIPMKVVQELAQNQDQPFQAKWRETQVSDWLVIRTPQNSSLSLSADDKPLDSGQTAHSLYFLTETPLSNN